jgi:hypothetical protein
MMGPGWPVCGHGIRAGFMTRFHGKGIKKGRPMATGPVELLCERRGLTAPSLLDHDINKLIDWHIIRFFFGILPSDQKY